MTLFLFGVDQNYNANKTKKKLTTVWRYICVDRDFLFKHRGYKNRRRKHSPRPRRYWKLKHSPFLWKNKTNFWPDFARRRKLVTADGWIEPESVRWWIGVSVKSSKEWRSSIPTLVLSPKTSLRCRPQPTVSHHADTPWLPHPDLWAALAGSASEAHCVQGSAAVLSTCQLP